MASLAADPLIAMPVPPSVPVRKEWAAAVASAFLNDAAICKDVAVMAALSAQATLCAMLGLIGSADAQTARLVRALNGAPVLPSPLPLATPGRTRWWHLRTGSWRRPRS